MSEPRSMVETLRDFVLKAAPLNIEYMVTGSFAMSAYGEIRATRDIDIVVQLEEKHIIPFTRSFNDKYYISENSVRWAIANRGMFNVVDVEWGAKIDCIVQKDTPFARQSFERRRKATVGGVEFWTSTKEDLILAKLDWARDTHSEMQIRDIANLTSSDYDSDYVTAWIGRMDLADVWVEVVQWKIQHQRSES